jgi:intracellular septation protein A
MAAFNLVVAILFFVFYFLYRGSDGERSVLVLVAALVGLVATIMSVVAYNIFTKKIENSRKKR